MRPPAGFTSQLFPLVHKFSYMVGLSAVTTAKDTAHMPLIRNYAGVNLPSLTKVNPHNTGLDIETGSICAPMSIIDKLQLELKFTLTSDAVANSIEALNFYWMPIFFSFAEKLDAADDDTGITVKTILGLITDATEEDITPLFLNTKHDVGGPQSTVVPVSTVNLTETFGILNMDTDLTAEITTWDDDQLSTALERFTNRGALKACIGKRRYIRLTANRSSKKIFINKFVPRSIRRIMPYTYMAIVVHVPSNTSSQQYFTPKTGSANISDLGIVLNCKYHEWNDQHFQDMAG